MLKSTRSVWQRDGTCDDSPPCTEVFLCPAAQLEAETIRYGKKIT